MRSVIGRFLEHSRVFYFENGGEPELYLRQRRLDGAQLLPARRGGLPGAARPDMRERILRDLQLYLADNTQAWLLRPDGSYVRIEPGTRRAGVRAEAAAGTLRGRPRQQSC